MSVNVQAEHLPDGRIRLLKHLGEVPVGFVCDGASVPRFLWRLFGHPYDRIHIRAGVGHDHDYTVGGSEEDRLAADLRYRDNIRKDGAGPIQAQLEYIGIRFFGRKHFNYTQHKRRHNTMKRLIITATLVALLAGCAGPKSRSVDADGMFVSETGQLAIGRLHVDAIPEGTDSAVIHYSEDTPLLQPSMKTHDIDVILTGTNSVSSATNIVHSICEAFAKVAAAKSSATAAPESPDSPTPTPTSN